MAGARFSAAEQDTRKQIDGARSGWPPPLQTGHSLRRVGGRGSPLRRGTRARLVWCFGRRLGRAKPGITPYPSIVGPP